MIWTSLQSCQRNNFCAHSLCILKSSWRAAADSPRKSLVPDAKPDSECQRSRGKQQCCPRFTYCLLHRKESTSFSAIGHEIAQKDVENGEKMAKHASSFSPRGEKMRVVFLPVSRKLSLPSRQEKSENTRPGRKWRGNKRSENMKFCHNAPRIK